MAVYFQLGLLRYALKTKSTVGIQLNTYKEKTKSHSKQESIPENILYYLLIRIWVMC